MEPDRVLTFSPVHHPDPKVQRAGFDLRDPYVEQCWTPVVGPSATLLLRRFPTLWVERTPARLHAKELSRSLGIGEGTGPNSRLSATMDRLVRFGLARARGAGDDFEVYLEVNPLRPRQLARLPEWTRTTHEHLLAEHIRSLSRTETPQGNLSALNDRPDGLEHDVPRTGHPSIGRQQALGR